MLVFIHGHKFRQIDNKIYSPGGLPQSILIRYVNIFGNIKVIARIIHESNIKKNYSIIDNDKITISNFKMKNSIKNASAVIIGLPSINGYRAFFYAKKFNKPTLIEVVGCVFDAYWNYNLIGKILAYPCYYLMKYCVSKSKYTVYVSQKFLQKRYPNNNKSIGISDVELIPNTSEVLENRLTKIRKNKRKIIIGTIAAIDVPHKGQEYIIRSIPKIEKLCNIEIEYHLVGSGNKNRLLNICSELNLNDKVKFEGFIKHEQIFEWLDKIDLYIQSSFQEGLCRSIVEAMCRGVPCIVSDVGGNSELINQEFIFSIKNRAKIPEEIAICVNRMLNGNNLIIEAKNNFYKANNEFSLRSLEEKRNKFYTEFYNEVVNV